jgi:hypothetical protein
MAHIRRGQWVVVGGKNVGIVTTLGGLALDGVQMDGAMVDLVDENGETLTSVFAQLKDITPVTVLADIPAPRRAHLPADFDLASGRGLAEAVNAGVPGGRAQFVPAKGKK